jgi:hypothetical protein
MFGRPYNRAIRVRCWAEVDVVDGRLYQGQANAQDKQNKLDKVTELVAEATAELRLAPIEVTPLMVLMDQLGTDLAIGRIRLLDENSIVPWGARRGNRLPDEQVSELAKLIDERFPAYDAPVSD